jgi:branched-chain amino acid transport system substrate-binding protein
MPEAIEIGVLFSTTGSYRTIGRSLACGAVLAMEEVSADTSFPFTLIPVAMDPGGSAGRYGSCARDLLSTQNLSHVVGCYTSLSRKEVIPFFEKHDALLWYPSHYEGFETCENVVYTGSAPNQHIVPLIDYVLREGWDEAWFIGSNYVWAWESHRIMRDALNQTGGRVLGERYLPIGDTDLAQAVAQIIEARPRFVFNNLIGESAYAFFRALRAECRRRGIDQTADMPVLSCTLSEPELLEIGPDAAGGHLCSSVYFQSVHGPRNDRFVAAWNSRFGARNGEAAGPTSADAESAYNAVHLLARALKATGGDQRLEAIREVLGSVSFDAPQGVVRIDPDNRHCHLRPRIGRSRADGGFDLVWEAPEAARPDPYLAWQAPWRPLGQREAPTLKVVR